MEWLAQPETWIAFLTLTTLEIVLGIDNIVFISILAAKLPEHQQEKARRLGLALAALTRIGLLFSISLIMKLEDPWFTVLGSAISGRDIVLILGGGFLLAKATLEIHESIEGNAHERVAKSARSFGGVIAQILLIDIVFSLDSVITAVGLVEHIEIMIAAILIAVAVMMIFVGPVSRFIERRPTVKMLALAFLLLIGVALIAEGIEWHIPRGFIYFAMAFSGFVEFLNLKIRDRRTSEA